MDLSILNAMQNFVGICNLFDNFGDESKMIKILKHQRNRARSEECTVGNNTITTVCNKRPIIRAA